MNVFIKSFLIVGSQFFLGFNLWCIALYDMIVIGGGPAGYSAALYGARAKVSTLQIMGDSLGGQLIGSQGVENWLGIVDRSGAQIMETVHAQVAQRGVQFLYDTVVHVNFSEYPFVVTTRDSGTFKARSLILATGSLPKRLNVPGEDFFWGNGVSSCAVCDCFLYPDKDVVVVGGGDSAIEEALQLVEYAKSVTILVRGQTMRAAAHEQDKLHQRSEKIKILYNSSVVEILGESAFGVTGVKVYNSVTEDFAVLPVDGVFLAIGHIPNTHLFKNYIELDETGHILLKTRSQMTNIPGVFVAGDVADNKFKQAIKAAGDGAQAALEAIDFLRWQQ